MALNYLGRGFSCGRKDMGEQVKLIMIMVYRLREYKQTHHGLHSVIGQTS